MQFKFTLPLLTATLVASASLAQTPSPEWNNRLSLGGTLNDGNSDTLQLNAALLSERQWQDRGSIRAGIEANYGESTTPSTNGISQTETTIDNAQAFANIKKNISPRWFMALDLVARYDDIALIDHRITVAPGIGAHLIKNDNTSLSIDIGPAYVWEKVAGISDDYPALRIGQRFDHKLSSTARIWQAIEYIPVIDDLDDYLLNTEAGAEAALNNRINLRLVLQSKYDNIPGETLEKHDLTLIGGISLRL